ncbi:MAG TPA: M20/M25/M40 family metallo-hydrolase [Ktedonobacteraceae bacterium]|nr:M20/M25/M40 family metallo-hydrolase [Ktedonobacteraceae bacterium]
MSISSARDDAAIYQRPAELLQRLVRFNTTNPPGNEAACISYINQLLTNAGFSTTILAADPERPNLIARLQGQGNAPPLLLQGHVDVVTTEKQVWQQPPFAGNIVNDYVWGRGTLDMKGGVAMMIAAFMCAGTEAESLPGDVILAVLSDEEAGGDYGAKYLVENHADIFKGTRYALGEFGGYTAHIAGKKFYPIQVLEKQVCWMKAIVRGPGGHGSLPMHGGATAKLAQMLQQLDRHRLPVHITPIPCQMLEAMSAVLPDPIASLLRQLLDPSQTDQVLDRLGPLSQLFDPILHNTVNVTIIQGGNKINVIPSEIVFEMDGRLLPGYTADDMVKELRSLLGNEVELELVRYDEGRSEADMGLYDTLATILSEADPEGIPVPLLMPAVTDGRFFSRLGIQTYGFLPMSLPADFNFLQTIHAADERIPVEAVEFGTRAIYEVLKRNKA